MMTSFDNSQPLISTNSTTTFTDDDSDDNPDNDDTADDDPDNRCNGQQQLLAVRLVAIVATVVIRIAE